MGCRDKQNEALIKQENAEKAEQERMKADFDKARVIKERQMNNLLKNRQAIVNPYSGLTNEMANLGVANKAAEFQAEQSDIALANTLDAMRASGAGAGGATALAQAALQSKKGIAASLQQQEAANQKAAAQGAQDLAKMKATGEQQRFAAQEARDNADINRASSQLDALDRQFESSMDAFTNAGIDGV
jgi:hypothetical protein